MEWKKRLYDHEEIPPEKSWEHLSGELDKEPWVISRRLQTHEEIPPPEIWDNINVLLEEGPTTNNKARPVFNLRKRFLKYAAAASVAGLIILSGIYLINRREPLAITDAVSQAEQPVQQKTANDTSPEVSEKSTASQPSEKASNNLPIAKEVTPDTGIPLQKEEQPGYSVNVIKHAAETYTYNIVPVPVSKKSFSASYKVNINGNKIRYSKSEELGTYLTIIGPEGQMIKVSPKFKNAMPYLQANDKVTADFWNFLFEDENNWQMLFEEWKQKLNSSNLAPDSRNFMDILELMRLIQENS
ncbi:MAG: hypothetical protein SFU87_11115 [Chitinophagaceae bacterium]|nr:hypothetical protein [Chitinophagaceae bacterium]